MSTRLAIVCRATISTALLVATLNPAAGSRSLGAQAPADRHPTLTVGSATAQRGQKVNGLLKVPAGSDAALDIPVTVVHGAARGPVLALVAGSHGTEYASIIALERLITTLDPAKVRGSVIIVPLVNIPSFEQRVAHLNPVDGKNMNREYPGKPNGTQTDRASFAITREVIEQADHVIDMHGGDTDESLFPFSYWTPTGNAAQDSLSRRMVTAFGVPHIVVSRDRPRDPGASRYLENTATTRGKASFTAEAGYHGTVMPQDVDTLVNGTLKVMAALDMYDRKVPRINPTWLTAMHTVVGQQRGIFHPLVSRTQRVSKGDKLGVTTDWWGKVLETVVAPAAGIVLYVRPIPSILAGETVAAIGVPGTP
ncbi:MAG: succinylglutamate desuccinylase/aspartoacylase family protein [Gemmatimonadaceae bacterium]|nr:succinylglutamate desuccinylase/aspartoacylase family protein [Gemmatimonadaceae bacterium]